MRTRPRSSKRRAPKSPPKRPPPPPSAKTSPTSRRSPGWSAPTGAGEVTFDLYKGADCSGQSSKPSAPRPPRSPKTANTPPKTSTPPPRGAGTYHWIAHFSGDANNEAVSGQCSDENETSVVEKASPEIATEATATATVGEDISDVATLSGLVCPTGAGELTFDIYKGADCSGQVLETLGATPASVTENGEYTSEDFDTTASGAGTYHWIAHFSGDANNEAVSGQCSDENEETTVEKKTPTSPPRSRPPRSPSAKTSPTPPPSPASSAPAAAASPSTSTRAQTARPPTRSAPP